MLESRTDGALEEEAARPHRRWSPALLVLAAGRALRRALPTRALLIAPLLGVLAFGGCTAVPALVQCRMAEASLRDVEGQAARVPASTYDLTLARAYLTKAHEESSEAHYGLAIQLAKSSRQASERVRAAVDKLRTHARQATKQGRI